MAQTINTNIASLTAQRNLAASQKDAATAMQRLSSGLRINSAKDDAAGLSIASRLTTQIQGMNQAMRNVNDGISLTQTAEGALSESTTLLQRMRELAIQSANTTNSASDRVALQAEVSQLKTELTTISTGTKFNNVALLDGTFTNKTFQTGAGATDTMAVSISGTGSADLGVNTFSASNTTANQGLTATVAANASAQANNTVAADTVTVTGSLGTAAVSIAANATAGEIATAVNAETASTNVSAIGKTQVTLDTLSSNGTVTFTLSSGGDTASISATVTTTDLTELGAQVNLTTGTHGITASVSGGAMTLTHATGNDIIITDFDHSTGGETINVDVLNAAGSVVDTETLTDAGTDSTNAAGFVTFSSNQAFTVTSAKAAAAGSIDSAGANTSNSSSSTKVSAIDIGTQSGATSALAVIDAALDRVNSIRADLGALRSRFESRANNLATTSENLSVARSRIEDADFAQETASLAKSQILQQAGISVLAQANAQPQNVLALLQ